MAEDNGDDLLDVTEVMAMLRCSKRFAYQRMRHWPPGFTVRFGRKIVVRKSRLQQWIDSGGDACTRDGGSSKRKNRASSTSAGASKTAKPDPAPRAAPTEGSPSNSAPGGSESVLKQKLTYPRTVSKLH